MAISAKLDESHADCPYTAKTTYGYCIYLDNRPLIWKSRRTTQVTTGTASTAYIAINYTAQEAIFTSMILEFMGHKQPGPMKIQSDNKPAVEACKTSNITPVVQTLSTIYHFIHDRYESKEIILKWISRYSNESDIFTCPLGKAGFTRNCAPLCH